MAKSEATTTKKRRSLNPLAAGVVCELAGGGWLRLVPQAGNVWFLRKNEELERSYREEHSLSLGADIPTVDNVLMHLGSQVGTVLLDFGDFDGADGKELASRDDAGGLHEENALLLLTHPEVRREFDIEVGKLNDRVVKDREVAEGNSGAPSAGT